MQRFAALPVKSKWNDRQDGFTRNLGAKIKDYFAYKRCKRMEMDNFMSMHRRRGYSTDLPAVLQGNPGQPTPFFASVSTLAVLADTLNTKGKILSFLQNSGVAPVENQL